jgi:hypothetical protein
VVPKPKPMRIQREGAELQPRGMRPASPGDDQARFLADLRALRDTAAIGYDELAARAHYPSDTLKEAENGPYLPPLPILAAYVRACEGNVPDWEERWRRLGDETRADPNLPVRAAGASAAAVAGARAGIGVSPPEAYDPERIKAALRSGHRRPDGGSGPTGQPTRQGGAGWGSSAARDSSVRWDQQDASPGWGSSAPGESTEGWALSASRDSGGAAAGTTSREAARTWDSGASSQAHGSSASSDIWSSSASSDVWGGSAPSQAQGSSASSDVWGGSAHGQAQGGSAPSEAWGGSASSDVWGNSASRGMSAERDAGEGWNAAAGGSTGEGWNAAAGGSTGEGWNAAASGSTGGNWDSGAHWDTRGRWDAGVSGDAAAGLGASPGWETTSGDHGIGLPSGNHHANRPARGPFEAAFTESGDALGHGTVRDPEAPLAYDRGTAQDERARPADGRPEEAAERARAIRTDPFSASWLKDSELTSRPDDGNLAWLEPTARAGGGESAAPEPGGSQPAGHTGPAQAGTNPSQAAGGAPARASAERPGATMTATVVSQPVNRRRSRGSSWKLLAVVILAALIGSLLVMMLR